MVDWLHRWLRRRHGDTSARVILRYRRLYILPTGQGWLFALLLAALWFAATNYRLNLGFVLTFLLVGVALVAMHHCYHNLVGITLLPRPPAPVFAGESARFPVEMIDPTSRARIAITATAGHGEATTDIAPADSATVQVPVHAHRRGRVSPGRIRVESRQPTGLFRAWSWIEPATTVTVYPSPEAGAPTAPEWTLVDEANTAQARFGDDHYHSLRDYQPGDPLRRVAWKASPGRTELQTKVFAASPTAEHWFAWADTVGLSTEHRLSRLAAWVERAHANGDHYGLLLPGATIAPDAGHIHRHRCLSALALFPE